MSTLEERFWPKVDKCGLDDCWDWKTARGRDGYGQIGLKNEVLYAHRVSWELHNGPIPDGALVCHTCDNKACVNPRHLFLGTHKDNLWDAIEKGLRSGFEGESNPLSKLTEEQVLEIRASNVAQAALAARYGVSISLISKILSRKAWIHI